MDASAGRLYSQPPKWPRSPSEKILEPCTSVAAGVGARATVVVVQEEEEVGAGHLGGGIGRIIQKSVGTKILPNYTP